MPVLINAGIYVLAPKSLQFIPRSGVFPITRLFDVCLERNHKVGGHVIEEDWVDVGRPDEFRRARGDG